MIITALDCSASVSLTHFRSNRYMKQIRTIAEFCSIRSVADEGADGRERWRSVQRPVTH